MLKQSQQVAVFTVRIYHGVDAADGLDDGLEFAFAQAFFLQVDGLEFDAAFFEKALGFAGVGVLFGSEDLDVHGDVK